LRRPKLYKGVVEPYKKKKNDTKCDTPSAEIFRILLQDRRYIKMDFQEVGLGGGTWTGLIWLRIRTSSGLFLVNAVINLKFYKMRGIS
jgi:hypothetical protein